MEGHPSQKQYMCGEVDRVHVLGCKNRVKLPIGAFGKFVSLKYFSIKGSPKLVAVYDMTIASILLPVTLLTLSMGNSG